MDWIFEHPFLFWGAIGFIGAFVTFIYKVGEWKGSVDTDRDAFKRFMKEIKDDIKTILLRLPPSTTTQNSPVQLTDLGKQVVEKIKPDEWIEPYASQRLPRTHDMSLYQIQQDAFDFAGQELLIRLQNDSPALVTAIENCAFQLGISVGEVMKALGVVLRDKLFQLKGLSIDDI